MQKKWKNYKIKDTRQKETIAHHLLDKVMTSAMADNDLREYEMKIPFSHMEDYWEDFDNSLADYDQLDLVIHISARWEVRKEEDSE